MEGIFDCLVVFKSYVRETTHKTIASAVYSLSLTPGNIGVTALSPAGYHEMLRTTTGNTSENVMPLKMPVISMAAANMPATPSYCFSTICGAYCMPSELHTTKQKTQFRLKRVSSPRRRPRRPARTYLRYPELRPIRMASAQYAQSFRM